MAVNNMGQEVVPNNTPPEPDDEGLEIVVQEEGAVEEPKEGVPTVESLMDRMELLIEENKQLRALNQSSIDAMGNAVKGLGTNNVPAPAAPVFDEAKFKEEFDNNFLSSPYEAMKQFNNKTLLPAMQNAVETLADKTEISRVLLLRDPDPEKSKYYVKYQTEVEEEVKRMPTERRLKSLNMFEDALNIVKARHVQEIVDMRVNEELEKRAKEGTTTTTATTKPTSTTVLSGGNTPPPKAGGKNQVVVSPAQKNVIRERANAMGCSEEYYMEYATRKGIKI